MIEARKQVQPSARAAAHVSPTQMNAGEKAIDRAYYIDEPSLGKWAGAA